MAKKKELLPVYLFVGEDKLKQDVLLKAMRKRIGEFGDISLNETTFEGQNIDPLDAVTSACAIMPFLSEKRLIVVKDANHLKKPVADLICDYLEAPTDTSVLVLIADSLDKRTRLYRAIQAIDKDAIVSCDLKTKQKDIKAFCEQVGRDLNINLEDGALDLLIEYIGNNTVTLAAELKKLAEYVTSQGRNSVDRQDVAGLVKKVQLPKPWDITNAMFSRDSKRCLEILKELEGEQRFGLLNYCLKEIRTLIHLKALEELPGYADIAQELKMPDWKVKQYRGFASNFSSQDLIEAICSAADCEQKMKSGFDEELAFELWVVGICTKHN